MICGHREPFLCDLAPEEFDEGEFRTRGRVKLDGEIGFLPAGELLLEIRTGVDGGGSNDPHRRVLLLVAAQGKAMEHGGEARGP